MEQPIDKIMRHILSISCTDGTMWVHLDNKVNLYGCEDKLLDKDVLGRGIVRVRPGVVEFIRQNNFSINSDVFIKMKPCGDLEDVVYARDLLGRIEHDSKFLLGHAIGMYNQ
jgi:hypothetical protein